MSEKLPRLSGDDLRLYAEHSLPAYGKQAAAMASELIEWRKQAAIRDTIIHAVISCLREEGFTNCADAVKLAANQAGANLE